MQGTAPTSAKDGPTAPDRQSCDRNHAAFLVIVRNLKKRDGATHRGRIDVKYRCTRSTAQAVDKEGICAIKIILRTTGSSLRLSVW